MCLLFNGHIFVSYYQKIRNRVSVSYDNISILIRETKIIDCSTQPSKK